jgi:hypothetical protein
VAVVSDFCLACCEQADKESNAITGNTINLNMVQSCVKFPRLSLILVVYKIFSPNKKSPIWIFNVK